jgi:hypothetical protein
VPLLDVQVAELVNRLELYLDASLNIVFNDVQILETSTSDVVIKLEVGKVTTTIDTGREYNIEIAPIKIEQPVFVRAIEAGKISTIVPSTILVDQRLFKTYEVDIEPGVTTTTIDSGREYNIEIAPTKIEQPIFAQPLDIENLITITPEVIELDATLFKTYEVDIPLYTNVLLSNKESLFVNLINLSLDATMAFYTTIVTEAPNISTTEVDIVSQVPSAFNTKQKYEIDIEPKGKNKYYELYIEWLQNNSISGYSTESFSDFASRLDSQTSSEIRKTNREIVVQPFNQFSVAAIGGNFRILVDRLRIPALGLGLSFIDLTINTSKEIQVKYFAPTIIQPLSVIPQQAGRVKKFEPTAFPIPITIDTLLDSIRIPISLKSQSEFVLSKVEKDIPILQTTEVTILSIDINSTEIELNLSLDSRMRFYSEILTMTNREATTEIDIISNAQTVATPTSSIYVNTLQLYMDANMAFYSQVISSKPGIQVTEIDIETYISCEFEYYNTIEIDVPSSTSTKAFAKSTNYEIDIVSGKSLSDVTYGDLFIGQFANDPISKFENAGFDSVFDTVDETLRFSSFIENDLISTLNVEPTIGSEALKYFKVDVIIKSKSIDITADEILTTKSYFVNVLEIPIDATMAFYSQVTSSAPGVQVTEVEIQSVLNSVSKNQSKLEIDVNLEKSFVELSARSPYYSIGIVSDEISFADSVQKTVIETKIETQVTKNLDQKSFIKIDAQSESVNISVDSKIFYINNIELNLDATMAFYSQVTSLAPGVQVTEVEIQSLVNLPVAGKSLRIDRTLNLIAPSLIEKPTNIAINVNLINKYNDTKTEFNERITLYDDATLQELKAENFEEYGDFEVGDFWHNGRTQKNIKITGTISTLDKYVIGTETNFDIIFAENDSIIINGEKFLVKDVANSEYLEVNVTPAENYNNVSAYREIFV